MRGLKMRRDPHARALCGDSFSRARIWHLSLIDSRTLRRILPTLLNEGYSLLRQAGAKIQAQVWLPADHHRPGGGAFKNQPDATIRSELIPTLTIGPIPIPMPLLLLMCEWSDTRAERRAST